MKVYKYTDIKYITDCIKYGIYAGKLEDFNDPYEFEGILYPEDYRICCLAKSPRNMLFWSYYVRHKGCCIEYEIPDDIDVVRNVEYIDSYKQHRDMNGEEVFWSLYTKGKEWEKENEVRIVYYKDNANKKLWDFIDDNIYFNAKVKRVALGLRTDINDENVLKQLRFINKYNEENKDNQIAVNMCMLSSSRFEIKWHPQFKYEKLIQTVLK